MSRSKAEASARLPIRRGLSEAEAAIYVGLGSTTFRELVNKGVMPRPRVIGSRRLWDVDDLDAAFRSLPLDGQPETPENPDANPWH